MSDYEIRAIRFDGERAEVTTDENAEVFGVYELQDDGTAEWIEDLPTRAEAEAFVGPRDLRQAIEQVLTAAQRIEAEWNEVIEETGNHPAAKHHERDDDARRDLAASAVAMLQRVIANDGRLDGVA